MRTYEITFTFFDLGFLMDPLFWQAYIYPGFAAALAFTLAMIFGCSFEESVKRSERWGQGRFSELLAVYFILIAAWPAIAFLLGRSLYFDCIKRLLRN